MVDVSLRSRSATTKRAQHARQHESHAQAVIGCIILAVERPTAPICQINAALAAMLLVHTVN